ncbi:hypothetical protein acsn021_24280 [Anaerocolumna cellulosilytica]|uniref:Uncharacterized protein n=1 Tax=Anaerocolumna cellulosilytica TaxID=433286 RepID=A0A6S6R0L2_9FIRM|nr:hypothetical protein [Anaerocolumna cellulosilytica]MBB5193927.1 hypothetical protein [Anaerocolumna cellulosilytica]BCJ94859.1 hypothetical protein acsn021_24280 [Anaerocolumna cellulosilytica]
MKTRENISLIVNNNIPNYKTEVNKFLINQNKVLLRNMFTLMGTILFNLSMNNKMSLFNIIPKHYAYSSIAVVEDIGEQNFSIDIGSRILLSPLFKKFSIIDNIGALKTEGRFYSILPDDIDPVDAIFLPLICKALELCEDYRIIKSKPILLIGCNILGAIILKLLNLENTDSTVLLTGEDLDVKYLKEYGASKVIYEKEIDETFFNQYHNVINLTSDYCNMVQWVHSFEGNSYGIINRDVQTTAIQLLQSRELYVKDLIALHVHAECVGEIHQSIIENKFMGKALIYDW